MTHPVPDSKDEGKRKREKRKRFSARKWDAVDFIIAHPELSDRAKLAAIVLVQHMNPKNGGEAWPHMETIVARMGCKNVRKAERAVSDLMRQCDLFNSGSVSTRKGRRNTYTVDWDQIPARRRKDLATNMSGPSAVDVEHDKSVGSLATNMSGRSDEKVVNNEMISIALPEKHPSQHFSMNTLTNYRGEPSLYERERLNRERLLAENERKKAEEREEKARFRKQQQERDEQARLKQGRLT